MNIEEYRHCRLCNSINLREFLNLGETALANSYLKKEELEKPEFKAPLILDVCLICGNHQLRHVVSPELLFKNYLYYSGQSGNLIEYFKNYANYVKSLIGKGKKVIVEIGGNDGTLLANFPEHDCINIDPSTTVDKCPAGIRVINDFFSTQTVSKHNLQSKADVVISNNCLAHCPDIHEIFKGIKSTLKVGGFLIFENQYWISAFDNGCFDTLYHEHTYSHNFFPIIRFAKKYNLEITKIAKSPNQGGTIRFVFRHTSGEPDSASCLPIESEIDISREVAYYKNLEKNVKLFRNKVKSARDEITAFLKRETNLGKTVSCYGVPAKFTTFMAGMKIDPKHIKYAIDDAPAKQGLYTPGTHIPIQNRNFFIENPTDYCIITAWNFANLIREKNKQFKGKWVIPFPELRIYED